MNVKFMIAVLTYVSVALVHECYAGGSSSKVVEIKDERQGVPTVQPKAPPFPPVTQPMLEEELKPAAVPAPQKNEEKSIVVYKTMKFNGLVVPYPVSAEIESNDGETLLKQVVCSIILLNANQVESHELAKKISNTSMVPENSGALDEFLGIIYEDIEEIGKRTHRQESAEEAILTLKQLAQNLKLSEIFSHTKFQNSEQTLESRVMITMNDNKGEVIILHVHPLPQELWNEKEPSQEEESLQEEVD